MTRLMDPELGDVRLCPKCGEWWPDDGEFYGPKAGACRACEAEVRAIRRRFRQRIARANLPPAVPGRCNAVMSTGRCGRLDGHRNFCRSTVAMSTESARKTAARKAA